MENHKINVPNHQPVYAGHHLAPCVENPKRLGPNPKGTLQPSWQLPGEVLPGITSWPKWLKHSVFGIKQWLIIGQISVEAVENPLANHLVNHNHHHPMVLTWFSLCFLPGGELNFGHSRRSGVDQIAGGQIQHAKIYLGRSVTSCKALMSISNRVCMSLLCFINTLRTYHPMMSMISICLSISFHSRLRPIPPDVFWVSDIERC
jgi:hypothetical protein